MNAEPDLKAAVAERRRQWERFAAWEAEWKANQPRSATKDGVVDAQALGAALQWYDEALALAERLGSAGPGAPEYHLDELTVWVRRWRRAWGFD